MATAKSRRTGTKATPVARRGRNRAPSAHALEREQEIYDVAAEIFNRKGYASTSLQDIADAVGLLKGSLYYYIDAKEDLLYHITRTIHDGALANLEVAGQAGPLATDRLRALVEGHVQAFDDRRTWIRVFYTEYGHLTGTRRKEIMAVRRQYEQFVDELLRAGQAEGSFCPDLDARILGNAILTMINGAFLWYKPGVDQPIAAVAKAYADFVLAGLRCPPEHEHGRPGRRSATEARRARAAASG